MMILRNWLLIILCMLTSIFTSCNDKDGDWDPMEWTVKNYSPEDISYDARNRQIYVNYKGGTIDFECRNYKTFWFAIFAGNTETPDDVYHHWRGEWFDIKIEGNVLHCSFTEDASGKPMEVLHVPLSAGDIFYTFQVNRTFGELDPGYFEEKSK